MVTLAIRGQVGPGEVCIERVGNRGVRDAGQRRAILIDDDVELVTGISPRIVDVPDPVDGTENILDVLGHGAEIVLPPEPRRREAGAEHADGQRRVDRGPQAQLARNDARARDAALGGGPDVGHVLIGDDRIGCPHDDLGEVRARRLGVYAQREARSGTANRCVEAGESVARELRALHVRKIPKDLLDLAGRLVGDRDRRALRQPDVDVEEIPLVVGKELRADGKAERCDEQNDRHTDDDRLGPQAGTDEGLVAVHQAPASPAGSPVHDRPDLLREPHERSLLPAAPPPGPDDPVHHQGGSAQRQDPTR